MKPTQEQILEWAREAGLKCAANYDYRGAYEKMDLSEKQDLDKTLIALTLAYAQGRKDENEACAAQVGQQWVAFEELKAAHYRHSPEPFDPFRFHRDLSTIFFSRDMADAIRARREQ